MLTSTKKAFTLLELIVVIVVLGILAMLAVPAYNTVKEKSADSVATKNALAIQRDFNAQEALAAADSSITPSASGSWNINGIDYSYTAESGSSPIAWTHNTSNNITLLPGTDFLSGTKIMGYGNGNSSQFLNTTDILSSTLSTKFVNAFATAPYNLTTTIHNSATGHNVEYISKIVSDGTYTSIMLDMDATSWPNFDISTLQTRFTKLPSGYILIDSIVYNNLTGALTINVTN